WRRRPTEYQKGQGWVQGGHKRRDVKKPYYHFIWPKDGKNGRTWGRWKDVLQGKGPDIHVTISANKNDYMYDRQRKSRWAGHTNLDDRDPDFTLGYQFPWTRKARPSDAYKAYDFQTRKYTRPYKRMWTDVVWQDDPNDHFQYPSAFKDVYGRWM
ncbi:hypothetical protein BCR34DRAFT_466807, partial [Clohesyomyces aquaticus]